MSEEKPRLSRRELRERGLLAPITEGPSPLEERRKREAQAQRSSPRATRSDEVAEREGELVRSSVFERFVSDDDEAPGDVLEGSVATGTVSGVDAGVADAVVDAERVETEYDLGELAEPKRHGILLILIFILGGLAVGWFIGFGVRSWGAYPDGEISPKFSVAVAQTVDSLQEENSVSI